MVPEVGIEPTCPCERRILSPKILKRQLTVFLTTYFHSIFLTYFWFRLEMFGTI